MDLANQPDRLQSSLFDRLQGRGNATAVSSTASGKHTVVPTGDAASLRRRQVQRLQQVRRELERDLLLLLTTRNISQSVDLSAWPQVQASVLNYGLPDLSGLTNSSLELKGAAKQIQRAIEIFEPRFHSGSVKVHCRFQQNDQELLIEIDALFGPLDELQTFAIRSTICLDSGQIYRRLAA